MCAGADAGITPMIGEDRRGPPPVGTGRTAWPNNVLVVNPVVGSAHHTCTCTGAVAVPAPQLATSTVTFVGRPRWNVFLPGWSLTMIPGHSHHTTLEASGRSIAGRPRSPLK